MLGHLREVCLAGGVEGRGAKTESAQSEVVVPTPRELLQTLEQIPQRLLTQELTAAEVKQFRDLKKYAKQPNKLKPTLAYTLHQHGLCYPITP